MKFDKEYVLREGDQVLKSSYPLYLLLKNYVNDNLTSVEMSTVTAADSGKTYLAVFANDAPYLIDWDKESENILVAQVRSKAGKWFKTDGPLPDGHYWCRYRESRSKDIWVCEIISGEMIEYPHAYTDFQNCEFFGPIERPPE